MINEKATEHIIWAADAEMRAAIEEHGEFHSHHEAYAVLSEECEEVVECFAPFERIIDDDICGLWKLIRNDAASDDKAKSMLTKICDAAGELAKECVQVMAMCYKWKKLINKER